MVPQATQHKLQHHRGQPIKNRSANETDWQDGSKCGGVRTGLGHVGSMGKLAVGIGIFGKVKLAWIIGVVGRGSLVMRVGGMISGVGWAGIVLVAKPTDNAGGISGSTGTFKAMAGNWAGLYACGRLWRSWVARLDASSTCTQMRAPKRQLKASTSPIMRAG
eukprot:scaffold155482_cov58-Attheya_sp.AAC.2